MSRSKVSLRLDGYNSKLGLLILNDTTSSILEPIKLLKKGYQNFMSSYIFNRVTFRSYYLLKLISLSEPALRNIRYTSDRTCTLSSQNLTFIKPLGDRILPCNIGVIKNNGQEFSIKFSNANNETRTLIKFERTDGEISTSKKKRTSVCNAWM